jgi:opacity protein-like surface antigen
MASGAQLGLGLQTNVTQNVDARFEYDYTAYNSVSGLKSPTQDAFHLGLIYKFD